MRQAHLSVNWILTFLSGREIKLVITSSGGPSCSILNLCTILAVIMYSSSWANLLPMQDLGRKWCKKELFGIILAWDADLAPWPQGRFAKGWAECLSLLSLSQRSGMNLSGLSKLQESLEVLWPILMKYNTSYVLAHCSSHLMTVVSFGTV